MTSRRNPCFHLLSGIVLGAACIALPSVQRSGAQSLHPEFAASSGSSMRAALLYPGTLSVTEGARFERGSMQSRPADPWISFDKAEHLTIGFLFTLGTQYILVNKLSTDEHDALPAAVGVAASAGVAKELYDHRYGTGYFSSRDLVADAAGIALAVGLILL